MTLKVYLHPLSSYCQKALTALYEKGVPFEARQLDNGGPVSREFQALWPIGKFPVAVNGEDLIFEATGIIEHLDVLYPDTPRMIPGDPAAAAEVRMWDRFMDNYVSCPQQRIVFAALGREPSGGDGHWREALETAYAILERRMTGRDWAAGSGFSLDDCSAAPALLYADWTHPIPAALTALRAYRARLLARPSYARALDEARPYRHLFPLGAPADRD